jgi:hypothetical protein
MLPQLLPTGSTMHAAVQHVQPARALFSPSQSGLPCQFCLLLCRLRWRRSQEEAAEHARARLASALEQAWRTPHPPKRGNPLLGTQPCVHQGFLKSWTANGLNRKVLERVEAVISSLGDGRAGGVRVFVTGLRPPHCRASPNAVQFQCLLMIEAGWLPGCVVPKVISCCLSVCLCHVSGRLARCPQLLLHRVWC